ncbi:MAG: FecCD family ABC transporter permease [Fusobacteriaceae bacterium]
MKKYHKILIVGILLIVTLALFFSERGYFKIDVLEFIFNFKNLDLEQQGQFRIFQYIRVPRILVAILAGGILSMSGVIFQGVLFNPLADSYILGISSGASFGAALSMVLGLNQFKEFTVVIMAFIFSMISLYFVLSISKKNGTLNSNTLILSGVIVSSFFSAGLSFLQFLKGSGVQEIIFWIMGSFSSKTWIDVFILFLSGGLGLIIFMIYSDSLNIISLGDRVARANGVDVKKVKRILLITASFLSAAVVSTTGVIGFIGLMIPHLTRSVIGSDNRKVIPISFIYGGLITMVADNIIRIYFPSEIPVGVITALFGAPFFIFIFRKKIMGRI